MKQHLRPVNKSDTWITPKYITDPLGEFDLDPAAHTDMPWSHAKKEYTIIDDGLKQEWEGRVWLNPPFSKSGINDWFKKMSDHNNGIMLCPASLETQKFRDYVWGKCSGILILDKRPKFFSPDKDVKVNCGQTICLIAYGEDNLQSLIDSKLGVVLKDYFIP